MAAIIEQDRRKIPFHTFVIIILIKGINNTYTLQGAQSNFKKISNYNEAEKRSKINCDAHKKNKLLLKSADIRHALGKKLNHHISDKSKSQDISRKEVGLRHLSSQNKLFISKHEKKLDFSKKSKRPKRLTGDLLNLDNNKNIFNEANNFYKNIDAYQNTESENNLNNEIPKFLKEQKYVIEPLDEAENILNDLNFKSKKIPLLTFTTQNPLISFTIKAHKKMNSQLLYKLRNDLSMINEIQNILNEVTLRKDNNKRGKRNTLKNNNNNNNNNKQALKPHSADLDVNKYDAILSGIIKARLWAKENKSHHCQNMQKYRQSNRKT